MESSGVHNDTRGWIMCIISGVACVAGASLICVDVLVRLIPGQRKFRIEESSTFQACSLSLSFGVMVFSALYSMLPSSKRYLLKEGLGEQTAGLVMMACFMGGFVGIQAVSRLLHQFMPSHVVDCDHTHDKHVIERGSERGSIKSSRARSVSRRRSSLGPAKIATIAEGNGEAAESTPLLSTALDRSERPELPPRQASARGDRLAALGATSNGNSHPQPRGRPSAMQPRRPSMLEVKKRVLSFVKDTKNNCDEFGPCYGYSDPCGQECFKHLGSRSALGPRLPMFLQTNTREFSPHHATTFEGVAEDEEEGSISPRFRQSREQSRDSHHHHGSHDMHDHDEMHQGDEASYCSSTLSEENEPHHHHVPENAFMAIGLQTVIAIALHKFPEGFITYATNHANPALGFNVFMALFVHNIAEGFAMALPLYMAIGSRLKAMAWSSVLGGLSQPLGAAIAVLWFKIAKRTHISIDNVAYAILFAVTAGIMTSVGLQLYVESISLNHNRNLSILFAFMGMTLLGVSNAMVAE